MPLMKYIIKSDIRSKNPAKVDKSFIFYFLHAEDSDFIDIGRKGYYEHCYTSNNINVYQPYADRMSDMGWCVSMTGQGCRYYEEIQKDGEFVDFWREFLTKLRGLTNQGCSVNVSRIDIATDDFDGLLDLGLIIESANGREFVSQFRTAYEKGYDNILTGEGKGRTIYFGTRKSSTLCRFYDKLIEQKQKYKNDSDKLKELDKIKHWIRMEFEFKREQAIKIVNIICDAEKFGDYFAKIVNGYVRFVEKDDLNVSRRTMKSWWKRFIGTLQRAKLSVGQFKSFSYEKMVRYYDKYLSTTIFIILSRMNPEEFLNRTYNMAVNRLKTKHNAIMADVKCTYDLTCDQWWDFLNPIKCNQRESYEVG